MASDSPAEVRDAQAQRLALALDAIEQRLDALEPGAAPDVVAEALSGPNPRFRRSRQGGGQLMQAILTILNQQFPIECADCDQRRLEDLARALDARLAGFSGNEDAMRRLVLTALSLLDEAQATSAALVRARCEIEKLSDMVVEAKLEAQAAPVNDERGRVSALRVAQGAA